MASSGTRLQSSRFGLNYYPHQFFDLSSKYIPSSVKEMYYWCRYLYLTHSEVYPIINKKAAYPVTDLVYVNGSASTQNIWKELLGKYIRIKEMEIDIMLDRQLYGNAFVSIYYPFDRYLICGRCKTENLLNSVVKWDYADGTWSGQCPKCKHRGTMKEKSTPVRQRGRVRLIKWNPEDIDVQYNIHSGSARYIYRPPASYRRRVNKPKTQNSAMDNRVFVADTPTEYLEGMRDNKVIELDAQNVYHFKRPSPSLPDNALGIPGLMSAMKDIWLAQTLRRAQEAISIEHVMPLTIISPALTGDTAPLINSDLSLWVTKLQDTVRNWRRDQNSIHVSPSPITVENVRGDAKAINVFQEMEFMQRQIAAALDVPIEFITGGLSWSGSSISLRILENMFINEITDLDLFLSEFLIPNLSLYLQLPRCEIKHRDFKMADDAAQKQISMSMRQSMDISAKTVRGELGFDNMVEKQAIAEETQERLKIEREMALAKAKTDAEIMLIQAEAQIKAQTMQMEAQMSMQQATSAGGPSMAGPADMQPEPGTPAPLGITGTPTQLKIMAQNFLKTRDPEQQEQELEILRRSQPDLAAYIRRFKARLDTDQAKIEKLTPPEVKPPRRQGGS